MLHTAWQLISASTIHCYAVAEHEIFGEVSSSDDEDDVNILDSGDESGSRPGRLQHKGAKDSLPSTDYGFAEAAASYEADLRKFLSRCLGNIAVCNCVMSYCLIGTW